LQPDRGPADDAPVHPAVAALPIAEKGLVLGALLARMPPQSFATRFVGASGERGRRALEALAAESRSARAATLAELIALCRAPVPAGIERIHPGWLRERLATESAAVVRAVADGMPAEVRRVADEALAERGERPGDAGLPIAAGAAGAAELRRHAFAGLVPMADLGGPPGPIAAPLMSLPLAAVAEAIEARGAEALGISLRGAPPAVVGRAAASLGERLAPVLLDAAARPGATEERDGARRLVERVAAERPADLAANLGARALARALVSEGRDATQAVAQRLPPALGRRLLAFADEAAAESASPQEGTR
jgi:hypothetical protein